MTKNKTFGTILFDYYNTVKRRVGKALPKQTKFHEDFIITTKTMMIKPIKQEGKLYSEVFEYDGSVLLVKMKPLAIVKKSCEYYGSSYDGLRTGTKQLINITHKPPIAINATTSLFMFPTTSPLHDECVWVASKYVSNYMDSKPGCTLVTFSNQKIEEISVSRHTFDEQMNRTARLEVTYWNNLKHVSYYKQPHEHYIHMIASEIMRRYRTDFL